MSDPVAQYEPGSTGGPHWAPGSGSSSWPRPSRRAGTRARHDGGLARALRPRRVRLPLRLVVHLGPPRTGTSGELWRRVLPRALAILGGLFALGAVMVLTLHQDGLATAVYVAVAGDHAAAAALGAPAGRRPRRRRGGARAHRARVAGRRRRRPVGAPRRLRGVGHVDRDATQPRPARRQGGERPPHGRPGTRPDGPRPPRHPRPLADRHRRQGRARRPARRRQPGARPRRDRRHPAALPRRPRRRAPHRRRGARAEPAGRDGPARAALQAAEIRADLPGSTDDVPVGPAGAVRLDPAGGGHQRGPAQRRIALHRHAGRRPDHHRATTDGVCGRATPPRCATVTVSPGSANGRPPREPMSSSRRRRRAGSGSAWSRARAPQPQARRARQPRRRGGVEAPASPQRVETPR